MSTIPEYEPRREAEPEATLHEFKEITTYGFQKELVELKELIGPGQLATLITVCIPDNDYLKEVIKQMTNNLNGR